MWWLMCECTTRCYSHQQRNSCSLASPCTSTAAAFSSRRTDPTPCEPVCYAKASAKNSQLLLLPCSVRAVLCSVTLQLCPAVCADLSGCCAEASCVSACFLHLHACRWNRFVIIGTGEPLAPHAAWRQLTEAFLQVWSLNKLNEAAAAAILLQHAHGKFNGCKSGRKASHCITVWRMCLRVTFSPPITAHVGWVAFAVLTACISCMLCVRAAWRLTEASCRCGPCMCGKIWPNLPLQLH
jgi:hypothetical protein